MVYDNFPLGKKINKIDHKNKIVVWTNFKSECNTFTILIVYM